jgi:hypothetical protein
MEELPGRGWRRRRRWGESGGAGGGERAAAPEVGREMTEVPIFYYFESETNTKRPPITNKPFARHQDVKVTPYPSSLPFPSKHEV